MSELSPLDDLRETRRRLADSIDQDVGRYAALLKKVASNLPGTYVAQPLLPESEPDLARGKAISDVSGVQPLALATPAAQQ